MQVHNNNTVACLAIPEMPAIKDVICFWERLHTRRQMITFAPFF